LIGTESNDLECQNKVFCGFFGDFWLRHTFQERIAPKSLDWDSLRMELSALNVVFTSFNFASCVQGILRTRASNLGAPFKILAFSHSSHARRWRYLAYVNASYPMSVAGVGQLRFCSQWAFKHAPLSRVPLCVSYAFLFYKRRRRHITSHSLSY